LPLKIICKSEWCFWLWYEQKRFDNWISKAEKTFRSSPEREEGHR
jgi:hypothetical protein